MKKWRRRRRERERNNKKNLIPKSEPKYILWLDRERENENTYIYIYNKQKNAIRKYIAAEIAVNIIDT